MSQTVWQTHYINTVYALKQVLPNVSFPARGKTTHLPQMNHKYNRELQFSSRPTVFIICD